jgi:DnaJ like chaperone protein
VVSQAEMDILKRIAAAMRIPSQDAESMFAMYGSSVEDAYKVLEIERTATDDEVKKAYRRMAMKHHPDKVATLGEDVKKAAEEKFKKITEAYDKIKKERGLN